MNQQTTTNLFTIYKNVNISKETSRNFSTALRKLFRTGNIEIVRGYSRWYWYSWLSVHLLWYPSIEVVVFLAFILGGSLSCIRYRYMYIKITNRIFLWSIKNPFHPFPIVFKLKRRSGTSNRDKKHSNEFIRQSKFTVHLVGSYFLIS